MSEDFIGDGLVALVHRIDELGLLQRMDMLLQMKPRPRGNKQMDRRISFGL
jgi:hypothetical protein